MIKRAPIVPSLPLENSIDSGAGLWYNKIYNFGRDMSPSGPLGGHHLQSEFYLQQKYLLPAILDLFASADQFRDFV